MVLFVTYIFYFSSFLLIDRIGVSLVQTLNGKNVMGAGKMYGRDKALRYSSGIKLKFQE